MRSLARHGQAALHPQEEMDYAVTLNRALPDDIRVLGWAPLPDQTFSARYSHLLCSYPSCCDCTEQLQVCNACSSPRMALSIVKRKSLAVQASLTAADLH